MRSARRRRRSPRGASPSRARARGDDRAARDPRVRARRAAARSRGGCGRARAAGASRDVASLERREDATEREVGLAAVGCPLFADGAVRGEEHEEALGRAHVLRSAASAEAAQERCREGRGGRAAHAEPAKEIATTERALVIERARDLGIHGSSRHGRLPVASSCSCTRLMRNASVRTTAIISSRRSRSERVNA